MNWILILSIVVLSLHLSSGASNCENAYLYEFGQNYTNLFDLESYSGKFLNDLGDYTG